MKKKIKNVLGKIYKKYIIFRGHQFEVTKYKDARRVNIFSKVNLTQEEKQKIDELYLNNYGKRVPYTWHRHFKAFTNQFDEKYFPELLYIPEFEYYLNSKEYMKCLADKNIICMIADCVGIKTPKIILSRASGIYRDEYYNCLSFNEVRDRIYNLGECFIKPTIDASSGRGCQLLNVCNGIDINSGKNIEGIIDELGDNLVIQERVRCHSTIAKLYPNSVNTFRVITYRWNVKGEEKILHVPSIMRIGRGGNYLDNAHAGGIFIAIDDDGTMHDVAFTEFKEEYKKHPDTNVIFSGYKVDLFPRVLATCEKLHVAIPQVGVINWDMTIDEEGNPLLIEANMQAGSIWLSQMAHGCGPFGEQTEEILQWLRKKRKE